MFARVSQYHRAVADLLEKLYTAARYDIVLDVVLLHHVGGRRQSRLVVDRRQFRVNEQDLFLTMRHIALFYWSETAVAARVHANNAIARVRAHVCRAVARSPI